MNQLAWDAYVQGLIADIQRLDLKTDRAIQEFLRDNKYSKNARSFIKTVSGGATTAPSISVKSTARRMNIKISQNRAFSNRRLDEIRNGSFTRTKNSITTLERQLRNRAKTISDAKELARTKSDLKRIQTLQKSIRSAHPDDVAKVLEKGLGTVNKLNMSRTLRSSLNAQVKTVAITEKTRVVSQKFFASATATTLIDVVLSSSHEIYDICDEVAGAGPYTKDTVPSLPLHPNCRCRYHRHTQKTEKLNSSRSGSGNTKKSTIEVNLASVVY